jgi:hypothetical protein
LDTRRRLAKSHTLACIAARDGSVYRAAAGLTASVQRPPGPMIQQLSHFVARDFSWGPVAGTNPPKMDGPQGASYLWRLGAFDR